MTTEPRMWITGCSKCNGRWAGHVKPAYSNPVEYVRTDEVKTLIAAAVLAEREECAKIAETYSDTCGSRDDRDIIAAQCASLIASDIRARNR
jgi:hypothetical protein